MLRAGTPVHSTYLDAIRGFEGFTAKADWDYAQFTNGYGTKAKFAGEVIDKAEADRRFAAEISEARAIVEKHAPAATEGTKAALTSLTFNAGTAWTRSGLGEAVRAGDVDRVRDLFVQYNKAGGEVLPGLAKRRLAEVAWIGSPQTSTQADGGAVTVAATVADTSGVAGFPPAFIAAGVGGVDPVSALPAPAAAAADAGSSAFAATQELPATPTTPATADAEAGDGREATRLATAVTGFAGEARLTQLLLASKLIGSASSQKDDEQATRTTI